MMNNIMNDKKIVILIETNSNSFFKITEYLKNKDVFIVNTTGCKGEYEYKHLLNSVREFSKSSDQIMLAKFSGRPSIVSDLGDECSDFIITLSSNSKSRYYVSQPLEILEQIIGRMEKEKTII